MRALLDFLEVVQPIVFSLIGVAAFVQWRRRGGEAAGWIAATFGVLGVVVLSALLIPEEDPEGAWLWFEKVVVSAVVLFPYLLYRFAATFRPPPPLVEAVAGAATVVAAGAVFFFREIPGEGEPQPALFKAYVYLILVQWVLLSVYVATTLWRGGRGQPTVARRRMRTLSLGATGMALAIVIAGSAPSGDEANASAVIVQLLTLVSAGMFVLGFAPPTFVRVVWRRPEENEFRAAQLSLMEATDHQEISALLLPHVSRLVGGRGAALLDKDGEVRATHGLTAEEAMALSVRVSGDEIGQKHDQRVMSARVEDGLLAVEATAFSPFFGREETEMLGEIAVLAELAFARAELFDKERRSQERLLEAQAVARMGSWEWDLETNKVTWSDELYRILGREPGEEVSYEEYMASVHPDDRLNMEAELTAILESGESFESEHRVVRPTGEVVHVQARGNVVANHDGKLSRMVGTNLDITATKREEEMREQFIARAAHELRTPVTSLLGFVEILTQRREGLPESTVQQALKGVERAGTRLSILVRNLLDMTRLQTKDVRVQMKPVAVRKLTEDVLDVAVPPEGTDVEITVGPDVCVQADQHRLEQILTNLLTNAYRYGGKNVVVESAAEDGEVVLRVRDNGRGVEAALVPSLFEPFARGQNAASAGGTGLGLAIARMLAEACEGDIWYEAAHPRGSIFAVRLKNAS